MKEEPTPDAFEARLRQAEDRFRQALDRAGHGVWEWNVATGAVEFSATWRGMLGYAEGDLRGHVDTWARLVHPEDRATTMAALEAHLAGQDQRYESTHRVRCKDGTWKWVLDRGAIFEQDEAGRPLRMIGTNTDISGQQEAESRLRGSEERLRLATEGAELGV